MKNLFECTTIKNMKLKNRFFKAAVWEELATEDGHMTDELFKMQIVYGGSMTHLVPPSPVIWGPSAVKNELTGIVPVEMNKEDILHLVRSYGKAAGRVKKADFDGVELHAAHGYLLSQFLCPHYNTRKDEYGGSIENRARIILEIYDEIRKTVGDDFPIFIKINSEDFIEDGLTSEESIIVSKMLEEVGIDGIEVSGGNESNTSVMEKNLGPARKKIAASKDKESYFRDHAARLSHAVSIPVILTGGNRHIEVMKEILGSSNIAYFALGRPMISEPDLINIWAKGEHKTPKCVSCIIIEMNL